MRTFVLDANAILAYLENRPGAEKVQLLFESRERGRAELAMSAVNWGEVHYILRRNRNLETTARILGPLRLALDLVTADPSSAERAAELKTKYKIGCADAFAADLAISTTGTLVTADREFRKLARVISLQLLPGTRAGG
jgi:predicted nucleic acid-binding protein